jgi:hypothetical protein
MPPVPPPPAAAPPDYMENGRLYHGYRKGMYMFPCDEVCLNQSTAMVEKKELADTVRGNRKRKIASTYSTSSF